ncbi:unnamed protein product [Durusdinium trenchii]|uniref:Uncharacterized protein n=1 Tax=Durusdinium trenchii TaxID=1381693 RepID=A0ABP0HQW6_9DINO
MEQDVQMLYTLCFLDAVFASEPFWRPASLAAVQELMSAKWSTVASAVSKAIKAVEKDFDSAIAEERSIQHAYVHVARVRSAVEFLQKRLQKSPRKDFDSVVESLDLTIKGYVEEGFDLGCPQLTNRGKWTVPYSHWWVYRVHRVSNVFGLCN